MAAPTVRISALADHVGQTVTLKGWLYNKRGSKSLAFLEVRDGSGIVQVIVSEEEVSPEAWQAAQDATQESALEVEGVVVADERQTGGVEVRASGVRLVALAEPYPITPKEHGVEFLMDRRHLWLRSQRQWAIARVRNRVIMAIHGYFQDDGFIQMDAPILTGNAVEGTSTLFELDYFDEPAYLTQSGQLHGEAMAMAHGKIYTFGPTFRAEKSKTRRHLTEFWMIEPEMAFHDLAMNMEVAEGLLRRIVSDVIEGCADELAILERDVDALRPSLETPYPRLSYSEAVDLLKSDETQDDAPDGTGRPPAGAGRSGSRARRRPGPSRAGQERGEAAASTRAASRSTSGWRRSRRTSATSRSGWRAPAPSSGAPTSAAATRPSSRATSTAPSSSTATRRPSRRST